MSLFGNSILAGSAGQGGADLGDTIEESLRFRGSQHLSRSFSSTSSSYTFSFWTKLAAPDSWLGYLFSAGGNNPSILKGQVTESGYLYNQAAGGATGTISTNPRRFRDPNAWYHIVYQSDSGTHRIFVNGVLSSTPNTGSSNYDGTFAIGVNTNLSSAPFQGYMADWHAIDGQALAPTNFGKYNEDGVWVPQDYTGSYGTNGFHLKFDSSGYNGSGGIGADHSGNGNDFTASGFDTGDVALYSPNVVSSTGSFYSGQGPELMFDGSSSTYTQSSTQGGTVTWTPSQTITYSSSVVVRSQRNAGDQCVFNGSTTVSMAAGGVPGETTIATGSGTISSMAFSGYYGGSVQYIKVDGTILVDNTDNDVDYFDTPTSNYATFNPSYPYPTASLSKANLRVDDSNGAYAPQTVASIKLDGKCYWEVIPTVVSSYPYVGVTILDPTLSSNEVFQQSLYVAADGGGGNFAVSISNNSFSTGTVLGFAYDSSNRQLTVTYDGTNSQTFTASGTAELAPMVAAAVNAGADVNYGQMPFLYTPPTGFSALQTNNLPEPTIKNGKEHFEAKLYSGTNSSNAITGLEFSPDLIWIKVRDAADNHVLVDTIRGTDSVLFSNSTDAQASSFSRFTSFDSNGFTVDSSDTAWNNSANDYVAWCWKAGGTAVSNSDGTITSSVSANTDAGFSIVSYTGNGTPAATVGHGLTEPPEWILFKNRTSGSLNWLVYHKYNESSAGAGDGHQRSLILNTTAAGASESSMLNNTAPSDSVITLGTAGGSNGSTTMIAYCWHSVPGYSAFGRYNGNATTNNSFVFTNFRPAFVMIKSIAAGGSWQIYDTTRNINNPAQHFLSPDNTLAETTGFDIDILSNGFKIRSGNGPNAAATGAVYACFAENPFGGEKQPPATAR